MTWSYWSLLIICPLVFLASLLDAVAGGGGLISLPAYLFAGLPPHNAIATNKLSSCIGTVASTGRFIKNKCVDWPTAIPSAALAVLGARANRFMLRELDDGARNRSAAVHAHHAAVHGNRVGGRGHRCREREEQDGRGNRGVDLA